QRVELAEAIGDRTPVEAGGEFLRLRIDVVDIANVAVVDLLVVVIFVLHTLVAERKSPAKALHLTLSRGVQGGLKLNVQRTGADAAAVHRTEHLNVADGIEAKAFWDAVFH